jgi:lipoyl(octanoyl) transferase
MQIRQRGIQSYLPIYEEMKAFTVERNASTPDQIWLLEHFPVYTQGQAGKPEHILNPTHIPIIQSDRGGQVTFHGPGQLVTYFLLDLQRRKLGVKTLVCQLEQLIIGILRSLDIKAETQCGAPGVYVSGKKIASIGLRVKNGCTYHGLALNVAMDLDPFRDINPCGYKQLEMTQIKNYVNNVTIDHVQAIMIQALIEQFR